MIASKACPRPSTNGLDQRWPPLNDPAAHEDAVRLRCKEEVVNEHRERMLDRGPAGPILLDWLGAVASSDRSPGCNPLDAIALIRASPCPDIVQHPRNTHLAHFSIAAPSNRALSDNCANAHSGPHRDISKVG